MVKAYATVWDMGAQEDARWSGWNGSHHSIVNGQLNVALTANESAYYSLTSVATLDLTESWATVELVQRANADSGSVENVFSFTVDSSNQVRFLVSGTLLIFRRRTSGTNNDTTQTYNATTHRFLRLRHSGSSIFWDTSSDGSSWTNRRTSSSSNPTVTSGNLVVQVGAFDTNNSNPGTAIWDNLNLPNQRSFFAAA